MNRLIDEAAYKIAWDKHNKDWVNVSGGTFARLMIQAYEAAKRPQLPELSIGYYGA